MSHATCQRCSDSRARLRLARLIVDHGWPIGPGRRALRRVVADRDEVGRPVPRRGAGRDGRPVLAPAPPARTGPRRRWSARSCTCAGSSGWARSQIGDRLGHAGLDRARGAGAVPAQPAHPHRPGHRRADPPLRARPPRRPDPRRRQEARQHPRRRRLALRRPPAGRHEPAGDRGPHRRTASKHHQPLIGTCYVHTVIDDHSRVAYAEIHDDETAATAVAVLRNARGLVRRPRRHRRAGAVRQRQLPTAPTCGATPAPSSASPPRRPGPTGPRPTARSNASTAPWPTAGPSRSSTTPNPPAAPLCQHGSTSTTTTGPTPRSARPHPSPGWTTWLGITASPAVGGLDRGHRDQRHPGQAGGPQRDAQPVLPQGEAQQPSRAGARLVLRARGTPLGCRGPVVSRGPCVARRGDAVAPGLRPRTGVSETLMAGPPSRGSCGRSAAGRGPRARPAAR